MLVHRVMKRGCLLFLLLICALPGLSITPAVVPQKDAQDYVSRWFGIRLPSQPDSLSGRSYWTVLPLVRYSVVTSWVGQVTAAGGFYLDRNPATRMSTLVAAASYTFNRQSFFPLSAVLWWKGNDWNLPFDWRYMHFPVQDFGRDVGNLEGKSYHLDFNYLKLHQTLLRRTRDSWYAGVGLYVDAVWNIAAEPSPPGITNVLEENGGKNSERAISPAVRIQHDSRSNILNPEKGWYLSMIYRPTPAIRGFQQDWQSLLIDARLYLRPTPSSRNVLALWSFNWFTLGGSRAPYLLLPSTGWDEQLNTGRGYIQGRFRARNMVYAEAEYRFGISRNGLLGGVVFSNLQGFSKDYAKAGMAFFPAAGMGLRIKLNKNSRANICIDYAVGVNGSHGFSFNLGEIF